jgi:hypothetical protein
MKTKRALVLGLSLIASCLFLGVRRGLSQAPEAQIVRIAELEIYPDQLNQTTQLSDSSEFVTLLHLCPPMTVEALLQALSAPIGIASGSVLKS